MALAPITSDSPLRGLAVELQRQIATKRDLMADTPRVSFDEADPEWLRGEGDAAAVKPGLSLLVDIPGSGVEAYGVTKLAHQQIGDHYGIGWKLYERLLAKHPDLLANLVNGLFVREASTRMLRTLDGKVRAFLSDRYRPRDNWDLLKDAVLPAFDEHPGQVVFKACDLTETRLYIKVFLPEFERPVTPKVGDVVRGGIIIQNSEVGSGSLGIFPYTDHLICLNGMIHTEFGQRQRHVGKRIESNAEAWDLYSDETLRLDDAAFFAKCRDTIKATLNETVFEKIVAQMRDLAEIRVEGDPVAKVEILSNKHGFTDGERGSILEALIEGSDLSGWGYVNAITQTARDLDNADRRVELETLAGGLVSDRRWALSAAA